VISGRVAAVQDHEVLGYLEQRSFFCENSTYTFRPYLTNVCGARSSFARPVRKVYFACCVGLIMIRWGWVPISIRLC
jgi:hypothetical protein